MKRALLFALPLAAVLVAVGWPIAKESMAGACAYMTPARILENPGIASEYAEALRSGDAAQVARVRALLEEIRALHGCGGGVAMPSLPDGAWGLPPGHPPVDGPRTPVFDPPGTISI